MPFAADASFVLFGSDHLSALWVTVALGTALVFVARRGRNPRAVEVQNVLLAVALLWGYPAGILARHHSGYDLAEAAYPMHFCDWAAIAGFIALIWRSQTACELTYFWGLAGTIQGLITPTVEEGFPHPTYFVFFLQHSSVVIAALYLPLGLRWRPRPGAYWRALGLAHVYLVCAGVVDWITGLNYGFLREKPEESLLGIFGDWPYYILGMQLLAAVILFLLYLPFLATSHRKHL